jgi:predicted small integral membrane protein
VERSAQRGNAVRWQSCLVKGVAIGDGGESHRRVRFAASGRYTTFLVFGGTRLLPSVARSQLYTILWVLPALMGVPVRHVLMMDSTFPRNHGIWRAVNSPLVRTVFYIGIIAWESVTMVLCWWAGVRLLKSYRADGAQFAAALNLAVIALTTSLLMWLVAFLDVGGEWFLMWQSQIWNGQEEAFRMFTIVGVVFLVVVQREPTSD